MRVSVRVGVGLVDGERGGKVGWEGGRQGRPCSSMLCPPDRSVMFPSTIHAAAVYYYCHYFFTTTSAVVRIIYGSVLITRFLFLVIYGPGLDLSCGYFLFAENSSTALDTPHFHYLLYSARIDTTSSYTYAILRLFDTLHEATQHDALRRTLRHTTPHDTTPYTTSFPDTTPPPCTTYAAPNLTS